MDSVRYISAAGITCMPDGVLVRTEFPVFAGFPDRDHADPPAGNPQSTVTRLALRSRRHRPKGRTAGAEPDNPCLSRSDRLWSSCGRTRYWDRHVANVIGWGWHAIKFSQRYCALKYEEWRYD